MRHLEIRDLWLQKEVREGRLEVHKVPGEENPADLMTKILSMRDILSRLLGMNICGMFNNLEGSSNPIDRLPRVDRLQEDWD